MPLVALTNAPKTKTDEWNDKLVGKTLSDEHSNETMFCTRELPQETRVLKPGSIVTRDYRAERLNVHTTEEGIVTHCSHG